MPWCQTTLGDGWRDILKFQGCLQPGEFLDWVAAVDEILDFNEIPNNRRVTLVATKFRETSLRGGIT